jgi:hypothetical protein
MIPFFVLSTNLALFDSANRNLCFRMEMGQIDHHKCIISVGHEYL